MGSRIKRLPFLTLFTLVMMTVQQPPIVAGSSPGERVIPPIVSTEWLMKI